MKTLANDPGYMAAWNADIPPGCCWASFALPKGFEAYEGWDLLLEAKQNGVGVRDSLRGDPIPDALVRVGVHSLLVVLCRQGKEICFLVAANGRDVAGRVPYQRHFTRAHMELARVIARVLCLDGLLPYAR